MNTKKRNVFTVGFIGTFSYWHGIDVIQELIKHVLEHHLQVKFLLIGDGVLLPQLKNSFKKYKNIESLVTFVGQTPQKDAPFYLSQCDAFLCPNQPNQDGSAFFGSPTKLFEYMAMAKPIIASDLEQIADVLNPSIAIDAFTETETLTVLNQVGILVDPLDVYGFINALKYCLNLPQKQRMLMGNNARNKVIQKYTWKSHVKKIINFTRI